MSYTPQNKLVIFIFFLFFLAFTIYIPYVAWQELQLYAHAGLPSLIIKDRGFIPPMLLGVPACLILTYGIFRRLRSKPPSSEEINKMIKRMLYSLSFFVLSLIAYPLYVDNYLQDKGYTFCRYYSFAKIGSADIWLADPSYCMARGTHVRYDLVKWMLSEQTKDNTFTQQQVATKIQELIALLPYKV